MHCMHAYYIVDLICSNCMLSIILYETSFHYIVALIKLSQRCQTSCMYKIMGPACTWVNYTFNLWIFCFYTSLTPT